MWVLTRQSRSEKIFHTNLATLGAQSLRKNQDKGEHLTSERAVLGKGHACKVQSSGKTEAQLGPAQSLDGLP